MVRISFLHHSLTSNTNLLGVAVFLADLATLSAIISVNVSSLVLRVSLVPP